MANAIGNNGGRLYSFATQPVLIDCSCVVDNTNGNGLGVRSVKGQGVRNIFMHTTATPGKGSAGYLNPNPAPGYALVQLTSNYNRYLGGFSGFAAQTTGSPVSIDSGLTVGNPYIIASVGVGPAGQATIMPVADVSGSLASKYFQLYDSYGNTFVIWFSVSGVGSAPLLGTGLNSAQVAAGVRGLSYVQQSIHTNDTAATIGAALVLTINNLLSGVSGVFSFTSSGTTTVTVVSTTTLPLAGVPQDGASPLGTGFAFALTVSDTLLGDWQAAGLPKGLNPAVGQSFIATSTGSGTSTGTVIAPGVAGITQLELVGDPNQMLAPSPQGGSPHVGGWVLVQMVQTATVTAPPNGSVLGMAFYVDEKQSPSNQNVRTV